VSGYTFTNVQANHSIDASFTPLTYTITASAAAGGSITPAGPVAVACGADQAFSIAADGCHVIADVVVDGVSQGPVSGYTFSNVQTNHAIDATFTAITYTITANAAPGGSISPPGASVACGTDQTFTIAADPCYEISDVVVDNVSQGPITSYTFTGVHADHTIEATFASVTATIALGSSPNPSVCQQSVTLTATMTPSSATGSVEFFDGAASLGTSPLSGGQASVPAVLSVGSHSLTAHYLPDGCFQPATSNTVSQSVTKAPTTVTVTSDINPSVRDQAVTFTATIDPPGATGTVTFRDSLALLGTASVSGGSAHIVVSSLFAGFHGQIKATYNGNACYAVGVSGAYGQLVYRAPTSLVLTSDINPSTYGQTVELTATITPSTTAGRIYFYDGANLIGSSGTRVLSVSNLLPGKHDLTAQNRGDDNYEPCTSPIYSQVVNSVETSTALTSDINPAKAGSTVNLIATVTPSETVGLVEFFDGATSLGTASLSSGTATLPASFTTGAHSLTATYQGNIAYSASTSPPYAQTIFADELPSVTVTAPNGGEILVVGTHANLTWTATDDNAVVSVTLMVSRDNGANYQTIVADIPNSGTYDWTVSPPGTNSDATPVFSALLKVVAKDNADQTGEDVSNAPFAIYDLATEAIVTKLEADPTADGIAIQWALARQELVTDLTLERSEFEVGPWAPIAAERRTEGMLTIAVDHSAEAGHTYWYRLIGQMSGGGSQVVFGPVKGEAAAPRAFALSAAWPNPSKGAVTAEFSVAKQADVKLSVIDVSGREVDVLTKGSYSPGRYQVRWDGRNAAGQVPPGLYFLRYEALGEKFVRRIVLSP
jgi:hypothetical protein